MSEEEAKAVAAGASAVSGVVANGSPKSVCNMYMEILMKEHNLTPANLCPYCSSMIAFHHHSPISINNSKKDGSKSAIPKWSDYKNVKPFLDRMERVLEADLIDQSHWPRPPDEGNRWL